MSQSDCSGKTLKLWPVFVDHFSRTVKEVCREAAISEASYYNWKAKYGGMEAADIKKTKDLEDENRRLKQMFADLSLECRALKDVIEKKL